jgi:hypothetical protein
MLVFFASETNMSAQSWRSVCKGETAEVSMWHLDQITCKTSWKAVWTFRRGETYLFLQHRRLLQPLDPLLAILQPPFRQQQARQNGITPHFGTLRLRHTLHQMQLRSFRNAVRHARAADTAARNTARHKHHAALSIRFENRHCGCCERFHAEHVRFPAAVPFFIAEGVEIVEVGEARPACVCDYNVEASED